MSSRARQSDPEGSREAVPVTNWRATLKDELVGVIAPGTTGLIVLAEDTAVVEIEKALAKADRIVTKAVDKELTKEIDREAEVAKDAVATS
jgi:hypothetical protein